MIYGWPKDAAKVSKLDRILAETITTNNEAFRTQDDEFAKRNIVTAKQDIKELFLEMIPKKYNGQFKSSYTIGDMQDIRQNTHGLAFETGYNKAIDELRQKIEEL